MGRPILEAKIKAEVGHLCQCFAQYSWSGTAFNPDKLVTFLVSNTISQLVFDRRFDYDDEEVARLFSTLSARESGDGIGFLTPFLLSERMSSLLSCLPMVRELVSLSNLACFNAYRVTSLIVNRSKKHTE